MLKIRNRIITLITIGVALVLPFLCMGSLAVKAYDTNTPAYQWQCSCVLESGEIESVRTWVGSIQQSLVSTAGTSMLSVGTDRLIFDINTYNGLSLDKQEDAMSLILETLSSNNGISTQTRLRLYNFFEDQDPSTVQMVRKLSDDVNADFATAYSWFKPFTGGISTILGILTLGIFICLTLMILIDLSYIVIPPIRAKLDNADGSKPKIVSNEAFKTMQEADSATEYKNTTGIYFKRKMTQLVIIAICLLYLIGGKIYELVGWFVDLFRGITG